MTTPNPSTTDPTLSLPRLLLFHGGGTNSFIFRSQCLALSKSLATSLRLVYVEAPYASHPDPHVARIFEHLGPFKAWFRWRNECGSHIHDEEEAINSMHACVKAAIDEDNRLGGNGEWVGLLGFSQGAKVCASLLYTQQYCSTALGKGTLHALPTFRFAVLIAGRPPLVWLDDESDVPTGLIDAATPLTANLSGLPAIPMTGRLRLPTLHVHGLKDPGLRLHRELLRRCCDAQSVEVLEWDGAHQVPIKPGDVRALAERILKLVKTTVRSEDDGLQDVAV
jgi:predicted esterase